MRTKIEQILERMTAKSKAGTPYNEGMSSLVWVARNYSKAELVNDLKRALGDEKENID